MQVGQKLESRLVVASWGVLFLWAGVCFLVGISWGVGLLGAAAIMLGTQRLRAASHLGVERFWVIVGGLVAAAGLWHMFDVSLDFGPVVFMVAGAVTVVGALLANGPRGVR